jgi:LemA protein
MMNAECRTGPQFDSSFIIHHYSLKGSFMAKRVAMVLASLAVLLLSGCGYNTLQQQDQQIKASWAEVLNQYQRRADLVPNLVNTVKGYANQERDVLIAVTNARAKVGSIQATPELINDPQAFQRFQAAQGELSSALSRLLVVAENYPQLKSDANFRDLQAQLEGTENRIAVARNRYIKAVQEYNVTVRSFPTNLTAIVFGHKERPQFTVENEREIAKPPTVDFGSSPTPSRDRPDSSRPTSPPSGSAGSPVPAK